MEIIVPIAGAGERFGGEKFKPLITVKGKTILAWTLESLGMDFIERQNVTFVARAEHETRFLITEQIKKIVPNAKIILLPSPTRGNLETSYFATQTLMQKDEGVLILDSDNKYNGSTLLKKIQEHKKALKEFSFTCCFEPLDSSAKWCFCVRGEGEVATKIMEKDPSALSLGGKPMFGVFYFSKISLFEKVAQRILENNIITKGEFYMSESLKQLLLTNVPVFCHMVNDPVPLGTPEDVERFANETSN